MLTKQGFNVYYPFKEKIRDNEIVMADIKAIWKSSTLVRVIDGNSSIGACHEAHEASICGIPVIVLNLTDKKLDPWTKFFTDKEVRSIEELINCLRNGI